MKTLYLKRYRVINYINKNFIFFNLKIAKNYEIIS